MLPQLHVTKNETLNEKIISPVKNQRFGMNKPYGGLWTSTYNPEYGSDWIRWCIGNDFSTHFDGFILYPKQDTRILTIDSLEDLKNIFSEYGLKNELLFPFSECLDFEAISKDYDGVNLTENGQWETRFSFPHTLYGWDCESTVWTNWCFTKVEKFKYNLKP